MAHFSALNAVYPPVAELVGFVAVQGGLVTTDGTDDIYNNLKLLMREQKGKDLLQLESVLDELEARFVGAIAPPGIGEIVFLTLRRVLDRYKSLILTGRAIAWTRQEFLENELIPKFIVPHVGWLLQKLAKEPLGFLELDPLLRHAAPLKVAFDRCFSVATDPPESLAVLYVGKTMSYRGHIAEHDIEDKRKVVRRWLAGSATPSLETCILLLDGLGLADFSGIVFWIWIARLLQKVNQRHRILIANWLQQPGDLPNLAEISVAWNEQNDAVARSAGLSLQAVIALRILTTLLFYNTHRYKGDKARAEEWLTKAKKLVGDTPTAKYYLTWLEARYHLYCRSIDRALVCYELAMEEGMYGDFQAETRVLPEWAVVAQKAGAKSALKRINSRLKFLRLLSANADMKAVADARLKFFHENLGAGRCFIESFGADGKQDDKIPR